MSGKVKLGIAVLLIIGLAVTWAWTPLGDYLDPKRVAKFANDLPESVPIAAAFLGVFAIGGILMLPMPLISFAVSLVFPLWQSAIISVIGSFLAACTGYGLGYKTNLFDGIDSIQKYLDKAKEAMSGKGAWAVVAFRIAPTPPFTVTSILSGSIKIPFWRYALGSVVGIFPFTFLTQVFGTQMLSQLKNPSTLGIAALVAVVLLFVIFKYFIKTRSDDGGENKQASASA